MIRIKHSFRYLIFLPLLLPLIACTGGIKHEAYKPIAAPAPDKALLVFYWPKEFAVTFGKASLPKKAIYLDGKRIGALAHNDHLYVYLDVPQDRHYVTVISASDDHITSAKANHGSLLRMEAGQTYYLRIASQLLKQKFMGSYGFHYQRDKIGNTRMADRFDAYEKDPRYRKVDFLHSSLESHSELITIAENDPKSMNKAARQQLLSVSKEHDYLMLKGFMLAVDEKTAMRELPNTERAISD